MIDVVDASRVLEGPDKVLRSFQTWCLWSRPTRRPGLSRHLQHDANDHEGAHEPGPEQDHDSVLHDADSRHCAQHHW